MIRFLLITCTLLMLALYGLYDAYGDKAAALAQAQADHQQEATRADGLANTLRLQRELANKAEDLDTHHTRELTDAKAENDRQRSAVAAGSQRLRVNATCPAVPDAAGAARLDDADAAELTPNARQDYHALRDELALSRQMILGLQEYVTGICLL